MHQEELDHSLGLDQTLTSIDFSALNLKGSSLLIVRFPNNYPHKDLERARTIIARQVADWIPERQILFIPQYAGTLERLDGWDVESMDIDQAKAFRKALGALLSHVDDTIASSENK